MEQVTTIALCTVTCKLLLYQRLHANAISSTRHRGKSPRLHGEGVAVGAEYLKVGCFRPPQVVQTPAAGLKLRR